MWRTITKVSVMPSTAIRRLNYSPETGELRVTFTSGRRYAYAQVPPEVHEAFSAAPSRGAFFNYRVRDRFACRELTRGDPSGTARGRSKTERKRPSADLASSSADRQRSNGDGQRSSADRQRSNADRQRSSADRQRRRRP